MKNYLILTVLLLAFLLIASWSFFKKGQEVPIVETAATTKEPEYKASYGSGYDRGYKAALVQFGINPSPMTSYTVIIENGESVSSEEVSEEEDMRGYVDGYHRALERNSSPSCPY